MKINLSYPATGCQKLIEISDELKVSFVLGSVADPDPKHCIY